MSPILLYAILPFLSTFAGGYLVYRWKRDLHPWLSFSGGVLLGVAFLDLFPEAIEQGLENGVSAMALGGSALAAIILFHLIDKLLGAHHHEHSETASGEHCHNEHHTHARAIVRASGMVLHSFFDGLAIGGGFALNHSLGILILIAVIMHDFSDGMSTVTVLRNALGHKKSATLWALFLDAIAPVVGMLVSLKLAISASVIAIMLAVFSGFFISLALSELLPQAHADETHRAGLALTIGGILLVVVFRMLAPL